MFDVTVLTASGAGGLTQFRTIRSLLVLTSVMINCVLFFIYVFILVLLTTTARPVMTVLVFILCVLFVTCTLTVFIKVVVDVVGTFRNRVFGLPIVNGFTSG